MAVNINFTVDDREVNDLLDQLQQRASNLSPAMRQIGEAITSNVKLGFREGRDPWGRAWEPLTETTISRRRRGSSFPLRDTGTLANSINYQLQGSDGVRIGPSDHAGKAGMHQFGGTTSPRSMFPNKQIPARPYLPIRGGGVDLPGTWQEEVIDILQEHLRS
jgi:phage virion morphogenesis protein